MSARRLSLAVLVMVGVSVFGAASAFGLVTHVYSGSSFGPTGVGVGGGSFAGVQGVAVDDGTGDVYVFDAGGGGSVYKFDASGEPAVFSKLVEEGSEHPSVIEGVGVGGVAEGQIAVDDSLAGPAKGDIYVANGSAGEVRVYSPTGALLGEVDQTTVFPQSGGSPCGISTDAVGDVYVAHISGHVDRYSPVDGVPAHDVFDSQLQSLGEVSIGEVCNIAADSEGSVYTDVWGEGANTLVGKYEALQFGSLTPTPALFPLEGAATARTVAVELSSNDVYLDQGSEIAQYNAGGTLLATFGNTEPGALGGSSAVAANGSTGNPESGQVYATNATTGQVEVFGKLVTLPDVVTGGAVAVVPGEMLSGTVNPNEVPLSSCEFEYGPTGSYGQKAPCSETPGPEGFPVEVQAELTGAQLIANGQYHYRLVARNAQGIGTGQDQTFTAPGPPIVESESVTSVTAESVTLQAQVNPGQSQTTYHFEYDMTPYSGSAQHGTSLPIPDATLGTGLAGIVASVHVQGLTFGTVYHYRILATNQSGNTIGPDATFTTQSPPGSGAVLPDGREYELVSPANKYGTEVLGIEGINNGGVVQAADDGSKISYVTPQPIVPNPPGNSYGNQVYSARSTDGWQSQAISTPHNARTGVAGGYGSEYRAFSSDLSLGLVEPHDVTQLTSDAPAKSRTLYLRNNLQDSYQALITASEAPVNPPNFELSEFVGASPDLSHIVSTFENLSEWSGGQIQRVSVLPNGEPTDGVLGSAKASGNEITRGAVSDDGSNTIWTEYTPTGGIYDRDLNTGVTVQVDASQGGSGSGEGVFMIAADNASKVFFTDRARLTADSTAAGSGGDLNIGDLYEFDANTHKLEDLSVDPGATAHVLGVIGASDDGSYVYFVARGMLAPGASSDVPNLYVEHEGASGWEAPKFILTLQEGDHRDWWLPSALAREGTSRVSSNGRFVTFVSTASLTGYDNRDAVSGALDTEVYLYDAVSGRLSCASCDPSGARPVGELDTGVGGVDTLGLDPASAWSGSWVAGMIPGATPFQLKHGDYESRVLSDGGRLFFGSSDALVSRDTNGVDDVYEFEPDGVGGCGVVSGCVSLVSAGTGGADSSFVDASTSGDDVFFITRDRLVGEDFDHVFDVYDAHVCSSGAPCFGVPAVLPPACSTGDGCKPSPSPQPSVFGDPSSATFSGVGNVIPVGVKSKHVVKKRPVKHKAKKKKKQKHKKKTGKRGRGKRASVGRGGARVSGLAKR